MAEVHGEPPPALLEKPELDGTQEELHRAYWLLAPSRPVGMGVMSGITSADIIAFAHADGWEPLWFLSVIRELDALFLEHVKAEADKQSRRNKAKK